MAARPDLRHGVLIAYCALAILAGLLFVAPPENSGEVAAWVQGVGTIAAVGVSAWVGLLPVRRQAAQEKAERSSFVSALSHGLRQVDRQCVRMAASLEADLLLEAASRLTTLGYFSENGLMPVNYADRRPDWASEAERIAVWQVVQMLAIINASRKRKSFKTVLSADPVAFRARAQSWLEGLQNPLADLKHLMKDPAGQ